MDRCDFSEFSFGYCVTEDLAVGQGGLLAAPIFPSLWQEGQQGTGYDVLLQRSGTPLFLQFKRVEQMVRRSADEARRGHFSVPFYRMHLRSRKVSSQHESLLNLEQRGNDVFYVAPSFHTVRDLNDAYANRQVWNRSFRIRPSSIGPLQDNRRHHLTFQQPTGPWRFYSKESRKKGRGLQSEEIEEALLSRIHQRGNLRLSDQIPELDAELMGILDTINEKRSEKEQINMEALLREENAIRRVSYVARQFFDCQLLFVVAQD